MTVTAATTLQAGQEGAEAVERVFRLQSPSLAFPGLRHINLSYSKPKGRGTSVVHDEIEILPISRFLNLQVS